MMSSKIHDKKLARLEMMSTTHSYFKCALSDTLLERVHLLAETRAVLCEVRQVILLNVGEEIPCLTDDDEEENALPRNTPKTASKESAVQPTKKSEKKSPVKFPKIAITKRKPNYFAPYKHISNALRFFPCVDNLPGCQLLVRGSIRLPSDIVDLMVKKVNFGYMIETLKSRYDVLRKSR